MAYPLMPKATAAWLVDNTALTFDQIAEFCGLHPLEIQALADGEVNTGIMGTNPVINGELTLLNEFSQTGPLALPVQNQASASHPLPAGRDGVLPPTVG